MHLQRGYDHMYLKIYIFSNSSANYTPILIYMSFKIKIFF